MEYNLLKFEEPVPELICLMLLSYFGILRVEAVIAQLSVKEIKDTQKGVVQLLTGGLREAYPWV